MKAHHMVTRPSGGSSEDVMVAVRLSSLASPRVLHAGLQRQSSDVLERIAKLLLCDVRRGSSGSGGVTVRRPGLRPAMGGERSFLMVAGVP